MMICSPSNDIKWTEDNQLLGVSNCSWFSNNFHGVEPTNHRKYPFPCEGQRCWFNRGQMLSFALWDDPPRFSKFPSRAQWRKGNWFEGALVLSIAILSLTPSLSPILWCPGKKSFWLAARHQCWLLDVIGEIQLTHSLSQQGFSILTQCLVAWNHSEPKLHTRPNFPVVLYPFQNII